MNIINWLKKQFKEKGTDHPFGIPYNPDKDLLKRLTALEEKVKVLEKIICDMGALFHNHRHTS